MKMKKIIAILLTLVMVTAMLPTVFAEGETVTWDPEYTFWYPVYGDSNMDLAATADKSFIKEKSSGEWNWVYNLNLRNSALQSQILFSAYETNADNNALILKCKLDKPGVYSPLINYKRESYTGKVSMWVVPATYADSKWTMSSVTSLSNIISDSNVICIMDGVDTSNSAGNETSYSGQNVYIEDTSFYVIMNVKPGASVTTERKYYGVISNLALTRKGSMDVSANTNLIGVGRKADITVSEVYDKYDNLVEDFIVTYSSSDDRIATVDNGVVTGISEGNVTITVTAATAEGTTVATDSIGLSVKNIESPEYKFTYAAIGLSDSIALANVNFSKWFDRTKSSGVWRYVAMPGLTRAMIYSSNAQFYDNADTSNELTEDNALILKAELDKPGIYTPTVGYRKYYYTGKISMYLVPVSYAEKKNWNMESVDTISKIASDSNIQCVMNEEDTSLADGESEGKADSLSGTPIQLEEDFYIVMSVKENSAKKPTSDTGSDRRYYGYIDYLKLDYIGEPVPAAPEYITLATSTSIAPNTINVIGNTYTRGTEVTVTAPDKSAEGYNFRHWVRGTADNGEVVSKSPSYSFPLMTNTYLTAVYSEKTDDKIVEFYNGNGEYLETKTVVSNAVELPTEPKMTGFKFLQWIVGKNGNESIVLDNDNVTADVTYAVAEFGDNETVKFTVAGESEAVVYDTSITRNSSDGEEKAWYRNGALVGYGTSYTFNVWADVTSIEEKAITTKAPVVYLDPVAKDSARMIEYDAGGKEIAEVGILFGDGTDMTVESCMYKATSTKTGSDIHGQFTAKPANDSYKNAKGYLIYKDGDTYKVVYSD